MKEEKSESDILLDKIKNLIVSEGYEIGKYEINNLFEGESETNGWHRKMNVSKITLEVIKET